MKRQMTSAFAALLLGASLWTIPVQATGFSAIQPYMTDYKIGFTNGTVNVAKAVYDDFYQYGSYMVVTKASKKGILDAKTGKELTPAIWDEIEIPNSKNIAIVRKGGWFQYLNLTTRKLSSTKFVGAHTYYLSPAYPTVMAMGDRPRCFWIHRGKC